ncbi:MAG: hypothetical protein ACI94Y_001801 [Maribacter sp.]|jgi:hypothetical protein
MLYPLVNVILGKELEFGRNIYSYTILQKGMSLLQFSFFYFHEAERQNAVCYIARD